METSRFHRPIRLSTLSSIRMILLSFFAIASPSRAEIREEIVNRLTNDMPVETFTITDPSGTSATVSNLGATLRSISTPDRNGKIEAILVGCKTDEDWLKNGWFFGSTVGRYANRIAEGKFTLNGTTYELARNNGTNHLHGGVRGFDKVIWESEITGENSVKFTYLSKDGEEGYPGNLNVSVEYSLSGSKLTWKSTATTDKATPVNLTNHAYFNLTGDPSASVLDHVLAISAEKYLPVDETQIPTGEMKPVSGTPFDFHKSATIAKKFKAMAGSYDHNYILDQAASSSATLNDPKSGRTMVLTTNQPGLQFYLSSPHGNKFSALCLEPQKFPDSPNQNAFPDSILKPGETYTHEISLNFLKP